MRPILSRYGTLGWITPLFYYAAVNSGNKTKTLRYFPTLQSMMLMSCSGGLLTWPVTKQRTPSLILWELHSPGPGALFCGTRYQNKA
jgi:hypothetical protein